MNQIAATPKQIAAFAAWAKVYAAPDEVISVTVSSREMHPTGVEVFRVTTGQDSPDGAMTSAWAEDGSSVPDFHPITNEPWTPNAR